MKVKFLPQNIECEIKPNQSVLDVANENNIYIKSVCRGVPACAECRVNIKDGEYNVFPPSTKELSLIWTAYYVDQRRLSCQLKCFGDLTIDLTEQIEKQNSTTKKPRGGSKDADQSAARSGNIIFEEKKSEGERMTREDEKRRHAEEIFVKEQQRKELERIKAKHSEKTNPGQKNPNHKTDED